MTRLGEGWYEGTDLPDSPWTDDGALLFEVELPDGFRYRASVDRGPDGKPVWILSDGRTGRKRYVPGKDVTRWRRAGRASR